MNTEDIPSLPDRAQRFEEIMVDCADEYENLSAFAVYLTDALRFPFAAKRGQGRSARPVTVLDVDSQADTDDVRLRVRQANGKEHSVPADQIWPVEAPGVNATVLDDYRVFVEQGGLPFDEYEEEEE
jgi:hypothetical protein